MTLITKKTAADLQREQSTREPETTVREVLARRDEILASNGFPTQELIEGHKTELENARSFVRHLPADAAKYREEARAHIARIRHLRASGEMQ